MKKSEKNTLLKHIKQDGKEFKGQIKEIKGQLKDDAKLKKQLNKMTGKRK